MAALILATLGAATPASADTIAVGQTITLAPSRYGIVDATLRMRAGEVVIHTADANGREASVSVYYRGADVSNVATPTIPGQPTTMAFIAPRAGSFDVHVSTDARSFSLSARRGTAVADVVATPIQIGAAIAGRRGATTCLRVLRRL